MFSNGVKFRITLCSLNETRPREVHLPGMQSIGLFFRKLHQDTTFKTLIHYGNIIFLNALNAVLCKDFTWTHCYASGANVRLTLLDNVNTLIRYLKLDH